MVTPSGVDRRAKKREDCITAACVTELGVDPNANLPVTRTVWMPIFTGHEKLEAVARRRVVGQVSPSVKLFRGSAW